MKSTDVELDCEEREVMLTVGGLPSGGDFVSAAGC